MPQRTVCYVFDIIIFHTWLMKLPKAQVRLQTHLLKKQEVLENGYV